MAEKEQILEEERPAWALGGEVRGPRSIQHLCQHLSWYGIGVDRDDIAKSDLGRNLRMLGLVLGTVL